MTDSNIIDKAVNLITEHAHPERIILFGSHAREEARDDSDIDLIVIMHEVAHPRQEMVRLRRVLAPLGAPIDIIVVSEDHFAKWSDAPSTTLYWAKREGKVLYDAA